MRIFPHVNVRTKARITAGIIRLLVGSLRLRFVLDDPAVVPTRLGRPGVYAFWHEMLLITVFTHAGLISPLISRSPDGEMITEVVRLFGGEAIRGSTNHDGRDRGGARALREMIRHGRERHIAITLDGPIGPIRQVPPGAIVLASRARMPIIPLGIAPACGRWFGKDSRLVCVPAPFCRTWVVAGRPIDVMPDLTKRDRDEQVRRVQAAMDDVQKRAESYAKGTARPRSWMPLGQIRSLY